MSWKDIRTAPPEKSIWRELSEDTFRQHLVDLEERTNAVPIDPKAISIENWSPDQPESSYTLSLETEQQIADDFACLAAVEEGAQSVAATCVQEQIREPGLTLRFAALDTSLNDAVKDALQDAALILAKASSDSRDEDVALVGHIDVLFDRVIQLHLRRLLARLRSVKWEKPKHLAKSHKKPLWQDFANLVHRAQFVYTKKEKAARSAVEKEIQELASVYEHFETTDPASENELSGLLQLVNASFSFCMKGEIQEYAHRLEESTSAKPTKQVASAIKCLRQIEKLAAYRRICVSLIRTARAYPALFRNGITMAYLTPYKSIPTTIGYEDWAKTCHVHAEVQLAVHYDLLSPEEQKCFRRPRAIGISKWLCYLCYQFLRAHGSFFPSKTHGRLYDQWTIPDLADFDEALSIRYRGIVAAVDGEVLRQTEHEPELWRIEPMTSRQDLVFVDAR
ncbi:hypothetical protein BDV97DRAFT_378592 [Delphinella strobiligena]|nr:hypothetical protein BDV97DRAFT_378592 [Delphinella strobiligena]